MWNIKVHGVFLVLLLVGILSLTYSLPTTTVVISSTGNISHTSITLTISQMTANASTAITTAAKTIIGNGGGTVYIPAGDWRVDQTAKGAIFIDLETLPSGAWLNIIGSYYNVTTTTQNGQSITCPATILRSTTPTPTSGSISTFNIFGSNTSYPANFNYVRSQNRHIRISGITILGNVTNDAGNNNLGMWLSYVDGFLIDHCAVDSSTGADIGTSLSKGVITNCYIGQSYHVTEGGVWGYGIAVLGNSESWGSNLGTATWINNLTLVEGLYDWQGINITYSNPQSGNFSTTGWTTNISYTAGPVYIENCYFFYCRHAVTSAQYGYYVARFNTCKMSPNNNYLDIHGAGFPSGRGIEAYNNTFIAGSYALGIRGGGGVFFNNTVNGTLVGVQIANDGYSASVNDPEYTQDFWIWNNTFINCGTVLSVWSNNGNTAGATYFSDVPTPTNPAPPRPGYVPYTYPHPLTFQATP